MSDRQLKLAGKMSQLVRGIVGGRDFTTGAKISPIEVTELSNYLNSLKEVVDEYDKVTIENSKASRMGKHLQIPNINGLFWYCVPGKEAEAVEINMESHGKGKFKGFNGRKQSWLRENEFLLGPLPLPEVTHGE